MHFFGFWKLMRVKLNVALQEEFANSPVGAWTRKGLMGRLSPSISAPWDRRCPCSFPGTTAQPTPHTCVGPQAKRHHQCRALCH
eukprot:1195569-Prorocentrum_minimum.AAC.8